MKNIFKKFSIITSLILFISLLLTSWSPSILPDGNKFTHDIPAYSSLSNRPNAETIDK